MIVEHIEEQLNKSGVKKQLLKQHQLLEQMPFDAKQSEQLIRQQSIINSLIQMSGETQDVAKILQTTLDLLGEAFGMSGCIICQLELEKSRQSSYVSTTTVEPENLVELSSKLFDCYQSALSEGAPLVVRQEQYLPLAPETRLSGSLMLVPLLGENICLGNICLAHPQKEHRWTEAEVIFMRTIATNCAIALHQEKLRQKVTAQQAQKQLCKQINQILNSPFSPEQIAAQILETAGKSLGVEQVILFRVDQEKHHVCQEWHQEQINRENLPTELLTLPLQSHAAEDSQTVQQQIRQKCRGNTINVPIIVRGEFFGSLVLYSRAEQPSLNSEAEDTLEAFAHAVAIALDKIQTQQSLTKLSAEKQQSEEANRAKSQFLSVMNHELRTPLTGILGFSRMLGEQIYGSLNDKQMQYVSAITDSGEYLLALINDFLDIAKIEAQKEELFLEQVAVEDLCLSSLSLVGERAREESLNLNLAIDPLVSFCIVDQRRVKQILVNLLSNAVKFTDAGGSVTLRVKQQENCLQFCVIDTGVGIKQEDQVKLFQPFSQVKNRLSRKHKGTGLGLALSRKLARLHGGDLTLASEEGKGSCFTLHIPT